MIRKLLTLAACLLILAIAGGVATWMVNSKQEVQQRLPPKVHPQVQSLTVVPVTQSLRVRSQGTVQAKTTTLLGAQVSGEIIEVSASFELGGRVQAGEVLLKVDPTDYTAALAGAAARVASAELQLAEVSADAANVERDLKQIGLDPASATDLVLRKPQLAVAEANLKAAQTEQEQARRNLERTEIHAPFDGIIRRIMVNRGQIITAIGTPLAEIDATDVYEVHAPVSNRDMQRLALTPGTSLEAQVHAEDSSWTGRVERTLGQIDSRDRMLRLVVSIEDPLRQEPALRAGQYVEIDLLGPDMTDAIIIPNAALLPGSAVLLVADDNTLHRREVVSGWSDETRVHILSGLAPGDRVCTTRIRPFVDGMKIEPVK